MAESMELNDTSMDTYHFTAETLPSLISVDAQTFISSSSSSCALENVTDKEDTSESMPLDLAIEFYDFGIFCSEEDYIEANIFCEDIMKTLELFGTTFYSPPFTYCSDLITRAEIFKKRCVKYFLFLTLNFTQDKFAMFYKGEALWASIMNTTVTQKNSIVPIHTQPPKVRDYEIPFGLNTLVSLNTFDLEKQKGKIINSFLPSALENRKSRNFELKVERDLWNKKCKSNALPKHATIDSGIICQENVNFKEEACNDDCQAVPDVVNKQGLSCQCGEINANDETQIASSLLSKAKAPIIMDQSTKYYVTIQNSKNTQIGNNTTSEITNESSVKNLRKNISPKIESKKINGIKEKANSCLIV